MIYMTPVERFDLWLQRHAFTMLLTLAWLGLTAMVTQKVDRSELIEVSRDLKAIKTLLCRDHPGDSLCPKY